MAHAHRRRQASQSPRIAAEESRRAVRAGDFAFRFSGTDISAVRKHTIVTTFAPQRSDNPETLQGEPSMRLFLAAAASAASFAGGTAHATGLATCDSGPPEKWQPQEK